MKAGTSDTAIQRLSRWTRNSPFLSSLRVRLVTLVLLAVLPALALIIYTALEQRVHGVQAAKEHSLRVVRMAGTLQDHHFESARQLLVTLAQLKAVAERDAAACRAVFTNLLELHPIYANISALRPDGQVFASAVPLADSANLADPLFFEEVTNRLDFVIGKYQFGRIARKATIHVAYPVQDQAGDLRAVLDVALDLDWLANLMTNAALPPGSSMTVMGPDRTTLFRIPDPGGRLTGQYLPRSNRPRPPPVDDPALRPGERIRVGLSRDGSWKLYSYTQLGRELDTNAPSVTVGIPLAYAYGPANRMLIRNLLLLGLATALAITAAWLVGDFFVVRRVRSLLGATARLSGGDLKARSGVPRGKGELHLLAQAFDEMAQSLEQRVAERERAQAQLRALNVDLEQRVSDRTRELQRSNEDLEQFAYVASHDLQEPLRMVTNYLQLLRQRYKGKLDNNAEEFIGFALDGAERMQQLIVGLLTYSRLGTKGTPLVPTNCEHVLERVLKNLKVAIEESGAKITHDRLPWVRGDAVQLGQLFQNLLSNAIKFRGSQPPLIAITFQRKGPDWQFAVRDNGIGINPKDFSRIFVVFQRLHSREKYPGTGIGLSLCKKIVERHGGQIWVESDVRSGSTFYFTLPAAETAESGVDPFAPSRKTG